MVKDEVRGKVDHMRLIKEMVLRHLQRRGMCVNRETRQDEHLSEQDRARLTLTSLRFPHRETRRGFEQASSLQFGLVTARGHDHLSPDTHKYSEAVAAAHVLARTRPSDLRIPYLTIAVTRGEADWHTDRRNLGFTTTMSFGEFTGGLLQVESRLLDTHDNWVKFSGHSCHRVTACKGDRRSISLYTPCGLERVSSSVWQDLLFHGFPVLDFCMDLENSAVNSQYAVNPEQPLSSIAEDAEIAEAEEGPGQHQEIEHLHAEDQPMGQGSEKEIVIRAPTPTQRAAIHRAHVNLGHPTKSEFLRALRISGMAQNLRLWIKYHYTCPACESCRKPGVRRPAILSRSFAFNVVVGFDSVEIHAPGLPGEWYLNVTCWGSRFQQLYRMGESPTSEAACAGLMTWVQCFGLMEAAVIDGGPEFKDKFAEQVDHLGIFTHCTDSYAPHQNGRTERAGAAVKEQLKLALETTEVGSVGELELLIKEVVNCGNAFIDRSGYSAHQRVFGRSLRQTLSGLQEDHLSADQLALDTRADFSKAAEIRTAALASLYKLEARTRVTRAARAKIRKTEDFHVGQWIFIHRRNKFNRYWREGPAVVVMTSGTTIWANHRGGLYKINKEMARSATTDELRGLEELTELLPELVEETVERRGRRQYKDLTAEVPMEMESEANETQRRTSVDSQSTQAPVEGMAPLGSQIGTVASEAGVASSSRTPRAASSTTPRQRRSSSVGPVRQVRQRMEPLVKERLESIEGAGPSSVPNRERSRTPPRPEETSAEAEETSTVVQGLVQKNTDEVKWRDLSPEEHGPFREAMKIEAQAMLAQ
eukprot:6487908-Amphidinium_carterae.2